MKKLLLFSYLIIMFASLSAFNYMADTVVCTDKGMLSNFTDK